VSGLAASIFFQVMKDVIIYSKVTLIGQVFIIYCNAVMLPNDVKITSLIIM